MVENHNSQKVACVVVTYNRLNLLKRCVESLRSQSCKDFKTIVVNNGSTDGTAEWLFDQTDITTINQENLGGAGGFYAGMKRAYEEGYDWIWMMDDDGVTDKDQLKYLLQGAEIAQSLFVNALVCNYEEPEKLAFGNTMKGKSINTTREAQTYDFIPDSISPFNGTFIHREVIKKIGMIKKEMFIWGDETEYSQRARKNGFKLYTITKAIHYHPSIKFPRSNVFPYVEKFKIAIPPKSRKKILYRNLGYNSHYASLKGRAWSISMYVLYYLLRLNFKGLYDYCRYFWMGYNDRYDL